MGYEVKSRSEINDNFKWAIKDIYSTNEEWEKDFNFEKKELKDLSSLIKENDFSDKNVFENIVISSLKINEKLEKLYVYASLSSDVDTNNQDNLSLFNEIKNFIPNVNSVLSQLEPKILGLGKKKVDSIIENSEKLSNFKHYFDQIFLQEKHILNEREENILQSESNILSASYETFNLLNNADLKFEDVEIDGEKVQLTSSNYSIFLDDNNQKVRKNAFKNLMKSYEGFKNTFSSLLISNVQSHNFTSKIRKYNSALEASLSPNAVPASVYKNLVEVVNNNLNKFHDYLSFRKKVTNLSEMHPYDLYFPLVKNVDFEIKFEEAEDIILEALAPLGSKYTDIIKKAFSQHWIDVYENEGKRSGAYSGGSYSTNPYILMNWKDNFDSLSTLVHELGHSVHSYLTRKNQPYEYGDYSIFVAEIASTVNESLLFSYMMDKYKDNKDYQNFFLNQYLDGAKGTLFRQTQFAEFEEWMHKEDQQGLPLTAEIISNKYFDINEKYYGESVTFDDQIAYEWARIPHFYYNFYVYQYATGFAAASTLADRIYSNDQETISKYIEFLSSGSSDFPIDVMKKTGIDMTKKDYLNDAMKVYENNLNKFKNNLS